MEAAEAKQLINLLDELCKAVEELLLAGLTAASKSTVERLDVSFKEASRRKLLRLGSTLRIANEEISRFTSGSTLFSAKRFSFFLGRAWVLATGMRQALTAGDTATIARLLATPQSAAVGSVNAVVLGVTKRSVPGAFASFDFRMRAIEAVAPIAAGESLVWSCVFPMRADLDLPAEAFLHLPQKQKFKPSVLLEKKVVQISNCRVSPQPNNATRITLGDASEVKNLDAFTDWKNLWKWDMAAASQRLAQYQPTPLALEIEFQEEVFLDEWEAGKLESSDEGYDLLPITAKALQREARLDRGPSGTPLHDLFIKLAQKRTRPPLFGVAHYESCRLIFQPLSVLEKDGPQYLTLSPDKISQAALIKAMKFT